MAVLGNQGHMHIKRMGYGVKGFVRLARYAIRWGRMVTKEAERKYKILIFLKKHGLITTKEAFGVGERTLYRWKAQLATAAGMVTALNNKSKKPHMMRKRVWPAVLIGEITRLRQQYPNLGKEKIHVLLQPFCEQRLLRCPASKTIGRIIADAPNKMRRHPQKVGHDGKRKVKKPNRLRKPKKFVATHPGHCGAFDSIEKHLSGSRRYIITFVDVYSRFSLAYATTSHASAAAAEFFYLVQQLFPYKLEYILTDNGSEFMKHFDAAIRDHHKTHWHTYPKTPKMNAHCERYNRTIQEEFSDYHEHLLHNPTNFNKELVPWLLWYNATRPHWALNLKSPIQFLSENNHDCHMWWPNTRI